MTTIKSLVSLLIEGKIGAYLAPSATVPRPLEAGLARLVASRAGVPIIASSRYLPLLEHALPCDSQVEGPAVYAGCKPGKGADPLLVVGVPGSRLQGFHLLRIEARRLAPGFFLLIARRAAEGIVYRSYVRLVEGGVEEAPAPCPTPLLVKLREALGSRQARLKDLIDAMVVAVGVPRGEARRIAESLVARGCMIEEEKGLLTLLV